MVWWDFRAQIEQPIFDHIVVFVRDCDHMRRTTCADVTIFRMFLAMFYCLFLDGQWKDDVEFAKFVAMLDLFVERTFQRQQGALCCKQGGGLFFLPILEHELRLMGQTSPAPIGRVGQSASKRLGPYASTHTGQTESGPWGWQTRPLSLTARGCGPWGTSTPCRWLDSHFLPVFGHLWSAMRT